MGLFQGKQHTKKQVPADDAVNAVEQILEDDFREELRGRARLYFDRVINENAALFKQDLDATVAHVNTELKQHVARQLDDQFVEITRVNNELKEHVSKQLDERFAEYDKTMKEAQGMALASLTRSAEALEKQHQQLSGVLEKSVADQGAMLTSVFQGTSARIIATKEAQDAAIQTLTTSVQALQEQQQQLSAMLQQGIAKQQEMMIATFEDNMAQIVEHYLLGALGDQYDMKAQLPSIIKQMEENKQAIADDMKL